MKNNITFTKKELEDFNKMINHLRFEGDEIINILKKEEATKEDKERINALKPEIEIHTNMAYYFAERLNTTIEEFMMQVNTYSAILTNIEKGKTESINMLNNLHPLFLNAFKIKE